MITGTVTFLNVRELRLAGVAFLATFAGAAQAQVVLVPPTPQIGSSNPPPGPAASSGSLSLTGA